MIDIRKHTIPKATFWIIRIAWYVRFRMVYMMRNHVNFFGEGFNNQVLGNKSEKGMPEFICFMRAIPMKPDSAMGSHDDHAINNYSKNKWPGKIMKQEKILNMTG